MESPVWDQCLLPITRIMMVDNLKLQLCLQIKLRITQTVYIEFLLRMLNWFPMNL